MNKKILFGTISFLFIFWLYSFTDGTIFDLTRANVAEAAAVATGAVTLTGTVQPYISMLFDSGATINFGNISPGVGSCANAPGNASGTVIDISTSAENGYTLAFYDGSNANSSMAHPDTTTFIPDITGTVASPALWVTGATSGVGLSLYAADNAKEATWGTGDAPCSLFNRWAKAPAAATTGHTVTGYHKDADSSSWGWKIDVTNFQKTGVYSGVVTFSAAPTLP